MLRNAMIQKFNIYLLLPLILYIGLTSSCSGSLQRDSQDDISDSLVDSLITANKINDHTLLVSFGADAVTAIKSQKGIVVIDAGISTALTSKYRKLIEEEFQSNKFTYLINTHSHSDHYGGNSVFPDAQVIGHENGIQEMANEWENPEIVVERTKKRADEYEMQWNEYKTGSDEGIRSFTQKTRYESAYKDALNYVSVKQADITFSDTLKLEMGNATFEMLFFGKCHSNSDILIYSPELKILFTGDLFTAYGRPSINDSLMQDKVKWKQAIAWIEKLTPDVETIISGHGAILSKEDLEDFSSIMLEKCSD